MFRNRLGLPLVALVLMGSTVSLSGCNGFFVCQGKASCPSSGTTSSSGDYMFVSDSASGANNVNAYQVSSGSLVTASGSPTALGSGSAAYEPHSMVVSTNNSYLYILSDAVANSPGIYGWSIGTGGVLTSLNGGNAQYAESALAIDVSPDGKWLFALNSNWQTIEEFSIASNGALTHQLPSYNTGFSSGVGALVVPGSLKVAPSGQFIAVQVSGQGTSILPLNSSTGAVGTTPTVLLEPTISPSGNYAFGVALAVDSSNYVYVARQQGIYVYGVSSSGVPSSTTAINSTSPYVIGTATTPSSMTISTGNNYLYAATGASTSTPAVYQFSIAGLGVLKALTPASVSAPANVAAIGRDSSGSYVIAGGYTSNGLPGYQMYSIGTTGALTPINNATDGTSTSVPLTMAFTH